MLRKAAFFLALTIMLLLPTLAGAYTIVAKVASGAGSIIPQPAGTPVVTSSASISVPGTASQQFTITPSGGYVLSKVYLDGVDVTSGVVGGNSYTVTYASGKLIRTFSVYFSAQANLSVNSDIIPAGSNYGYVLLQKTLYADGTGPIGNATQGSLTGLSPGDYVKISAVPATPANNVTNLRIGSTDYPNAAPGTFSKTIQMGSTNVAVTASFTITASITPALSANPGTVIVNTPVTLDATGTTANVPVTYMFAAPGATVVPNGTTGQATFTAAAPGNYTATVTVTGGGISQTASAGIIVLTAAEYANQPCTACHATMNVSAQIVIDYAASSHDGKYGVTCDNCHVATPIHPGSVNSRTVSTVTFTTLAADVNGLAEGATFCSLCHSASIPADFAASIHATAGYVASCSGCHASPHNPDTACSQCHGTENGAYAASGHGTNARGPACGNCHSAGGSGAPHTILAKAEAYNSCGYGGVCHNVPGGDAPPRHFSNISASYPNLHLATLAGHTRYGACAACHFRFDPHSLGVAQTSLFLGRYTTVLGSWASSGHGDTNSGAWKITAGHKWDATGTPQGDEANAGTGGCVRCHTPEGFLRWIGAMDKAAFTNTTSWGGGVWGDSALAAHQPAGAVLGCYACHKDAGSGLRNPGAVTVYYNYSSDTPGFTGTVRNVAKSYPDVGSSNLCISCHSGTQSADTIRALTAKFGNLSGSGIVIAPHGAPAALTLFGNGYDASPFTPTLTAAHDSIGVSDTNGTGGSGPCVTCHGMNGSNHTLAADPDSVLCTRCHDAMNSTALDAARSQFDNSVAVLCQVLANAGLHPSYLDGGLVFTAADKSTMNVRKLGMAMSIQQVTRDKGSFAHNPVYVRKTISDAIDVFDDGKLNGSVPATVGAMQLTSAPQPNGVVVTAEVIAGATNYLVKDKGGCAVCHSDTSDPVTGKNIVATFNASRHAVAPGGPTCASCHAPSAALAHPPAAMLTAAADIGANCLGCHGAHPWPSIGICMQCHNGHDPGAVTLGAPHFASFTTAQYVTVNIGCNNCHTAVDSQGNASFNIYSANYQWARSSKANATSPSWTAHDFKTRGAPAPATPATSAAAPDCVRCHTTTGYINYVTSNFTDIHAWGVSGLLPGGDRTREMISCAACHDPTPFRSYTTASFPYPDDPTVEVLVPPFARRVVPPVTAYYNYSTGGSRKSQYSFTFDDTGDSNICIVCHSGTVAGKNLGLIAGKVGLTGGFWNNADFVAPHPMAAAGILFGGTSQTAPGTAVAMGFHYRATSSYYPPATFIHYDLGDGVLGPCVACHMETAKPHLFAPVSTASNGVIAKVATIAENCTQCHDSGATIGDWTNPANLEAKRSAFVSSLNALAASLARYKGIYSNPGKAPYFFTDSASAVPFTNWGSVYTMGAAFNLQLLWSDKGAFAHNDAYAKRLIYDTIDYLDDGAQNNTVFATVQNLPLTPSFTAADRSNALGYVTPRP